MDREQLIAYVGGVQGRTYEAVALLRDSDLAWRPRDGELSAGELVRHIAHSRLLNLLLVSGLPPVYRGHEVPPGTCAADLRVLALRTGKTSIATLHGADLEADVRMLSSEGMAPAWRLVLGGLIEHEVHHRSQLCTYLGPLGIEPPRLFGLHAEELPRRGATQPG